MAAKNRDFDFGKRAATYDDGLEGRLSKKFYAALLSQAKPEPGMAVLDVGCGTGYLLGEMSRQAPIVGFGIDTEKEMVAVASRACPGMNIQVCSCDNTPFESSSFDIITACMAYHHFADKPAFLREAFRLLRDGGSLFIADPRFPRAVRKPLNMLMRARRMVGEFYTPDEIIAQSASHGFQWRSTYARGYVLVVGLQKPVGARPPACA